MRKMIIKVMGLLILMLSTTAISGCQVTGVNSKSEGEREMILKALEEKYGEEFDMSEERQYWGSMNSQTVKARCYPEKDPTMRFNVEMNVNTNIVYDKYLNVVVGRNEQKIIEEMAQLLWEDCRVDVYNDTGMTYPEETEVDMRYEEFLKLYPGNWQLVRIYINASEQVDEQEEVNKYQKFFKLLAEQKYFKSSVSILYLKQDAYDRYDELRSTQENNLMYYYADEEPYNLYCICGFDVGKQDQPDKYQEEMVLNFDVWGRWGEWR